MKSLCVKVSLILIKWIGKDDENASLQPQENLIKLKTKSISEYQVEMITWNGSDCLLASINQIWINL